MRIKYLLLIILFLGAAGLFVQSTYDIWTASGGTVIETKNEASPPDPVENAKSQRRRMPSSYFSIVAQKNPFSPDRSEFNQKAKAPPTLPKKIARTNPMVNTMALFGVILTGNEKKALIWVGKSAEWVKLGGKVSSLTLDEVEVDKVVLSDASNKYELRLDDQSNPQKKSPAKVAADAGPTIILAGTTNMKATPGKSTGNKPITIGSSKKPAPKKKQGSGGVM